MEEQEPDGGPVTDKVNELANRHEPSKARDFARMLQNTDLNSSATVNASFEEGNTDAESWNFWNPPQVGNIQRVEGIAQTGNASVLLENTERAGVYQTAPAHSGLIASQVYYYTPPGTETEGSILLVIEGFSADGEKLVTYLSNQVPLADTVGEWASVSLLEEIPQTVNGKEVSEVLVNAQIFDAVGVQVYQDDLGVYQNAEEESPAKMMLADVTSGPLMSGEPVFAKSSKDATLYLVPEGTEETKKAIEGGAHSPDRSVGRKTPGLQLNSCQF